MLFWNDESRVAAITEEENETEEAWLKFESHFFQNGLYHSNRSLTTVNMVKVKRWS
jgi:hypothetical protein